MVARRNRGMKELLLDKVIIEERTKNCVGAKYGSVKENLEWLCQAQLNKVLNPPELDKPDGGGLWIFVGKVNEVNLILLCITSNTGCYQIAHYFDGGWIPTTNSYGARYIYYEDMKGTWQRVLVPE